ncbi:WG repeat-containing protein [Paenibacillus arenilitoris]|uniref:WG repeat-containing protein n=1 Tax=Paenibacillus arenilitoris TaxID=2772299 RepID=A0A927CJQ5_9BACL|nr:WG repeat-containing protein [Paenibacillus arenilitoris]MBD2867863.1 WG repeat-containing protein [Paenibacillus arenilitoris]
MAVYDPSKLMQLASAHLPDGARLMMLGGRSARAAVIAADIAGDRVPEVAAAYCLNGELYMQVLKCVDGAWAAKANARGSGCGVTLLAAAPVTRAGRNNLIVGWKTGEARSKLSVYEWTRKGLEDVAPADLSYTFLEAGDMPGAGGRDGKAEIALWSRDAGDAYRIEVMRWNKGAFMTAPDVYPFYFPGVVRYYERVMRGNPDLTAYGDLLTDARNRAVMGRAASQLIDPTSAPRVVGLFPASVKTAEGTKWGYIDEGGRMAIQPRYDDAGDFQENGLAIVREDGRAGIIDATAHYVVPPNYESINPFSERRAVVIDGQGFRLIDEAGTVLTRKAYSYISSMKDGRAVFYVAGNGEGGGDSRYGYLDSDGNEAIPAQYEEANDFEDGKAVVKIKDKEYALIGPDGSRLATYPLAYVGPLGDGRLAFQSDMAGKYGYIDERGTVVLQPAYTSAFPFRDGRAIVNTAEDYKSAYGVIDEKGEFVVKPAYNDIRDLGEERFALGRAVDPEQPFLGSMYAIADRHGKLLSDFLYNDVTEFREDGLASATDARETMLIDRGGKPARGYPRVNGSGELTLEEGGLIKAFVDRRLSYMNRAGDVIWKQNTIIPLRSPYRVKEEKYKPNPDYLVYYPQVGGMTDQAAQRTVNNQLKELSQVKPIPGDRKLDYSYTGDFDVAFYKNKLLELRLDGYHYPFGAAHGMPTQTYAIVDLGSGRMYALKDLFKPGSDYVKALSDIVGKQIKEDPQYSYVFPDSYTGIRPDQPFYVTEDALHLYFAPYDIGPYAAGFPTFTIPFGQIMELIDTEGAFWRAFHG